MMNIFGISIGVALSTGVLVGQDFELQWEQEIRGRSASGVALGDVDGDGDVDAVLCQSTDDSVLLLNDGSGVFAKAEVWVMPKCTDGELVDLDGDGDLDFFHGQHLGECGVGWNDGHGGFTDSGQVIGSRASRSEVLLVDVDDDGDLDAVLPANSSADDSVLWLNSGAGVFVDSGFVFGSFFARDVAAGDVDDDGDLDLLFGINGRNKLFLNDGSGVFVESAVTFATEQTFGVALGDLDGDDDLDLFVVNGNQTSGFRGNEVWINDGSGGFTSSGQDLGDDYSFDVLLHDVDGDGDLDAIEGTNVAYENHLWLNDGSGVFSEGGIALGDARVISLERADLNDDGREDFFAAASQEPSEVWLGGAAPDLLFDSGQRLGGVSAQSVVAGDLDGDGDVDAIMGTLGGRLRVMSNDGTGKLSELSRGPENGRGNSAQGLELGDFDDDGDLDLVVVNGEYSATSDRLARLWLNDGAGNFALGMTFPDSVPTTSVKAGDLDGDGDLDLVMGRSRYGQFTGENGVFLNDGSGDFAAGTGFGTDHAQNLVLADFDDDGDLDVMTVSFREANKLWVNDGNGVFSDSGQALGEGKSTSVVAADFDGDGDLDAVVGNDGEANVLWLNDGTGTFTAATGDVGFGATRSVALVDPNGDGVPDIWVGNGVNSPAEDWVYLNDGAGGFTRSQTIEARTSPALAVADFTGNGEDDLLLASAEGDHGIWAIPDEEDVLAAFLAGFGISGANDGPGDDADGDGLLNFEELAFNLDPSVADEDVVAEAASAVRGRPFLRVVEDGGARWIEARVIRRRGAGRLGYALTVSPDLRNFAEPAGVEVSSEVIDDNYERALYRYEVPAGNGRHFGRVELRYQ